MEMGDLLASSFWIFPTRNRCPPLKPSIESEQGSALRLEQEEVNMIRVI